MISVSQKNLFYIFYLSYACRHISFQRVIIELNCLRMGGKVQALKLNGKIDKTGKLILPELVDLAPGDVEIIILRLAEPEDEGDTRQFPSPMGEASSAHESSKDYKIKALADWFANLPSDIPQIDDNEVRWQALKEKHNL